MSVVALVSERTLVPAEEVQTELGLDLGFTEGITAKVLWDESTIIKRSKERKRREAKKNKGREKS
jgi:hypothetical protein